mgnify:CR=1 FL=1
MMSDPKVVICQKQAVSNVQSLRNECTFIKSIVHYSDDGVGDKDVVSFKDLLKENQNVSFEAEKVTEINDRVAYIINSSGTSGLPKGVMIPHATLRTNISHYMLVLHAE